MNLNLEEDLTITRPESVLTGRTNQDLENGKEEDDNNKTTQRKIKQ